jgi:hypothetical protein
MRTKILAALVAGGVLVGAGFLTSVISLPGTAQAQEEAEDSEDRGPVSRIVGFLGEVLDELVGDGTITQEQADAIVDATENRIDEWKAENRQLHDQLSDILEDGAITEEEASVLPDDHWLFGDAFDEAWEDGELSLDDLRELRPFRRGHDLLPREHDLFRHGLRFGALLDDGGIDQEEYDNLDDEHPLKQLDVSEYLEDGLISPDELREIFSDLKGSFGDA